MILPNIIVGQVKPNRLEEAKDLDYHIRYARYCLKQCNNAMYYRNMWKYIINHNFRKGNQWLYNEDLELFFEDSTGAMRNRIKWCFNMIGPIVDYFISTAIRSHYEVRAYNNSPFSFERKQKEISMKMRAHSFASAMPLLKDHFASEYGLADSPEETLYNEKNRADETELTTNGLIRHIEDINNFDWLKRAAIESLVVAGCAVAKHDEQYGQMQWENVDFATFLYDTGATKPDLSDGEFMGDWSAMVPTSIFEKWPGMNAGERKATEKFAQINNGITTGLSHFTQVYGTLQNRVPVFCLYWKDTEKQVWGYVQDENDQTMPARLDDDDGDYKIKDALKRKDIDEDVAKRVAMRPDGTMVKQKEIVRYCEFIPREYTAGNDQQDIVLEYGVCDYPENYSNSPWESAFPYKVATTFYKFGELITPLDSHISPQRLMNRLLSVQESRINNSGGTNVAYDKTMNNEEEVLKTIKEGNPLGLDASKTGGNIQNSIMQYNASTIPGAVELIPVIQSIKGMMVDMGAPNEYMQGTGDANRVLKSVQESLVNQGTQLQEYVFDSLEQFFNAIYRCIANNGRVMYAANERSIIAKNADGTMQYLKFTQDMAYEEQAISLRRVSLEASSIEANNDKLFQYLQFGVIGRSEFANLFNRAETDEVAHAIRQYDLEVQKKQQAANEQNANDKLQQSQHDNMMLSMANQKDQGDKQFQSDMLDKKNAHATQQQQSNAATKIYQQQDNSATKLTQQRQGDTTKILLKKMDLMREKQKVPPRK